MENIFFESWGSIIRIFIVTILAYIILIFFLLITGKRTLSQMNAFDFIITISLGSTLSTVAINKNIPLANGALVLFLLILLQYCITWISVRKKRFKELITNQPVIILYKGKFIDPILKKERITREDALISMRKKGISSYADVDLIILETTGELSIIENIDKNESTTIYNLKNIDTRA